MQCHNCDFQNIPGVPSCARCQSQLDLKQISILPPRADPTNRTKWKRLKSFLQKPRSFSFLNLSPLFASLSYQKYHEPAKASLLFNIFLPGLGHYLVGYRILGRRIMILWGIFAFLNLIFVATSIADLFFIFLVLTHFYALLFSFKETLLRCGFFLRLICGTLLFIALQFLYYQPISSFIGNCSRTLYLSNLTPSPLLKNDDVLLYSGKWFRSDTYTYGDMVVYEIENGYGVDKIIGVPGDTIEIKAGILYVNGKIPEANQLPMGRVPKITIKILLASREYCILPSLLSIRGNYQLEGFFARWSRIGDGSILGKVWWRIRPLSRLGSLD
ncbi:MAG: S26 family signal peptidase [Planctomycetota bacterium]|mgnify:CR=1 FL=1